MKNRVFEDLAHYKSMANLITFWLENPNDIKPLEILKAPDGSPIGNDAEFLQYCSFDD